MLNLNFLQIIMCVGLIISLILPHITNIHLSFDEVPHRRVKCLLTYLCIYVVYMRMSVSCVFPAALFEKLQVITGSLCTHHREHPSLETELEHTYLETGPPKLTPCTYVCVCVEAVL